MGKVNFKHGENNKMCIKRDSADATNLTDSTDSTDSVYLADSTDLADSPDSYFTPHLDRLGYF